MRYIYSETLLEHFDRPRHVGEFDSASVDVGSGSAGSLQASAMLVLQIQVDRDGLVIDTRFKAYGPPSLIAAGSWLAEAVLGGNLEQAEALSYLTIVAALQLPSHSLHCAMLAEDAIRAAVKDYKDKQRIYA